MCCVNTKLFIAIYQLIANCNYVQVEEEEDESRCEKEHICTWLSAGAYITV